MHTRTRWARRQGARALEAFAALAFVMFCARPAHAIAPPVLTDEELARADVIVVATWDAQSGFQQEEMQGPSRISMHTVTDLLVTRAVQGVQPPGKIRIAIDYGLAWDPQGRPSTGTSTDLPGDVLDVRKPGLWFLNRTPKGSPAAYTPMGYHRSIQPVELEAFFKALSARDPLPGVREALASSTTIVALRALEHAAGGRWPWPYGGGFFDDWLHGGPRPASSVIPALRDGIVGALAAKDPQVRARAVALIDDLDGDAGPSVVRSFLGDPDPDVRCVTVGLLVARHDTASYDRFAEALAGAQKADLLPAALNRIALAKDVRVVPALLGALELDSQDPDDPAPALVARESLRELVGYTFPFSVAESRAAWEEARVLPDASARRAKLLERLGPDDPPLRARIVKAPPERPGSWIEITNLSGHALDIASGPAFLEWSGPGGHSYNRLTRPKTPEYVRVPARGSIRIHLELSLTEADARIETAAAAGKTELGFLGLRLAPGARSWMGRVNLEPPAR